MEKIEKIEVVSIVGTKKKKTYHPKYGGLWRGRMVTVDKAILKDSKIFVTKEEHAKYKKALEDADKKAAKKTLRTPGRPENKAKEVSQNATQR